MISLTPKQSQLFRYLESYMSGPGSVAPSIREMMAHTGARSTSRVFNLLVALEDRGYIRRETGRARAIEIVRDHDRVPHALTLASDEQLQAEIDRRASLRRAA